MKSRLIWMMILVATALLLAACGGSAPAANAPAAETTAAETTAAETTATDAATEAAATVEATPTHDMASMAPGEVVTDTEAMTDTAAGGHDMAGMDMDPATAFDLRFIDSMIPHHEGAIAMAQQALEEAEHDEIKQLAQEVIDAQEGEIAQLQAWRAAWYADAPATEGMEMQMGEGMGMMEVPAGDQPFDLRFIDAVIPHHEDAIMMAQEALAGAEHDEIKQLAQGIIDAQQAEIAQLQEWRAAWYPNQ